MSVVFADTFYYLAWVNSRDAKHERARQFSASFAGTVVTSDWVITELANGLCKAINKPVFTIVHSMIQADVNTHVVPLDRRLQQRGVELFTNRLDKDWSLTDCISMIIMKDLDIAEIVTADQHFTQAGFRAMLHDGA